MILTRYELYQGEEYLGTGTAEQLANEFNTSKACIYRFASNEYHKRDDGIGNQKLAFKIGENIEGKRIKSRLERKVDKIEKLYFEGYDLKTLLRTIGG